MKYKLSNLNLLESQGTEYVPASVTVTKIETAFLL